MFRLAVGVLIGVLISALVIPARQQEQVVVGTELNRAGPGLTELPPGPSGPTDATGGASSPDAGSGEGAGGSGTKSGGPGTNSGGPTGDDPGRADAPGGATTTGGAPGGSARGVTDDSIKIGIAILDLTAFRNLGPAYDAGDPEQMAEGVLDGWRRQGLVPVHGRDVTFVYRRYNAFVSESERAACVGFTQDDQVFMVQSSFTFLTGSDCVAREFKTPMVTTDAVTQATIDRTYPFLFTLMATQDRILRNFAHWVHERRDLRGKKIGLYYADDPVIRDLVSRNLKATLTQLGHDVAAEATSANSRGGPEDALAVQRFRAAGVDLAIVMTSRSGFLQQAQAQNYRPTFVDSDFTNGVTDAPTSDYPEELFDGSYGMTTLRGMTEAKAGYPATAEEADCAQNYERYSGRRVTPERPAEWPQLQTMCDTLDRVILPGLTAAGRTLTPQAFINAIETSVRNAAAGYFANLTFTPAQHAGGQEQRTAQWEAACTCWKAVGSFAPMWAE